MAKFIIQHYEPYWRECRFEVEAADEAAARRLLLDEVRLRALEEHAQEAGRARVEDAGPVPWLDEEWTMKDEAGREVASRRT
jgi:hypothetical protein